MDVIVDSDFILTPYYDGIIKDTNEPFWYENQSYHHTPYDFFILKTRLKPYINPCYTIEFDSNRYEGQMRYIINFSNGFHLVPLNKQEAQHYQTIVNTTLSLYPRHVTLLYTNQTLLTTQSTIPLNQTWATSVLPYIYQSFINQQYEPILYENQLLINIDPTRHYDDTMIDTYQTDSYYKDYNYIYNQLQDLLINHLSTLYKQGVILLNPEHDEPFITDWQLRPLYKNIKNTPLYTVDWTSSHVENQSVFLQDQLQRNHLLKVDIDQMWLKMNHYDYYTLYGYTYIKVKSYEELKNLLQ